MMGYLIERIAMSLLISVVPIDGVGGGPPAANRPGTQNACRSDGADDAPMLSGRFTLRIAGRDNHVAITLRAGEAPGARPWELTMVCREARIGGSGGNLLVECVGVEMESTEGMRLRAGRLMINLSARQMQLEGGSGKVDISIEDRAGGADLRLSAESVGIDLDTLRLRAGGVVIEAGGGGGAE